MLAGWSGHRDKVSALGAITVSPAARRLGFYFATDPKGFFNAERVADFLRALLRHLRGRVIVVWDGGSNHRGPPVRALLEAQPRLTVERLPAYAPELNPVEAVWSWLKYGQLANYAPPDVAGLDAQVVEHLLDVRLAPSLLRRLWDGSDLPFPTVGPSKP